MWERESYTLRRQSDFLLALITVTVSAFRLSRPLVACNDKEKAVLGEAVGSPAWWEKRQWSQMGLGIVLTLLLITWL